MSFQIVSPENGPSTQNLKNLIAQYCHTIESFRYYFVYQKSSGVNISTKLFKIQFETKFGQLVLVNTRNEKQSKK